MNREQFLKNLRASKVPLHPLQVDGWEGTIYLRPTTIGEVRDILLERGDRKEGDPPPPPDPLYIARTLAGIVRDEEGNLLFDPKNDTQVAELMEALADAAPSISRQINQAYDKLNSPSPAEVSPEGKSLSATSS